ncbi:MAG: hypothetical protein ACR2JH_06690 [Solirubrobacteraceae bacterium]
MSTTHGVAEQAEPLPARKAAGQLYPWIPGKIGGAGIARAARGVLMGEP